MIIAAYTCLHFAAICAALGAIMTSLESLWHWRRGNYSSSGIWPWHILRHDHGPLRAIMLTPAMDGAGLLFSILIRLSAAIALPFFYFFHWNATGPLLILLLSQMLQTLRCRLGGEGGDQMTTLVFASAVLPEIFPNAMVASMAAMFVGAQIFLSYIASGTAKLLGPLWRNGEALTPIMSHFQFGNVWLMNFLRSYPPMCRIICLSVIGFQVSFFMYFLLPAPYAYIYLLAGIAFHAGIAYLMRLYLFVFTFLGTYPCLIFTREVLRQYLGL